MPAVALSQSAAQELIKQYSGVINANRNGEYSIDKVISLLEGKVNALESIALSAYQTLGISAGNTMAAEAILKQRILELQKDVAALNGINLQNCFLKALKSAPAFNISYEQELLDLQNHISLMTENELNGQTTATILYKEIMRGAEQALPDFITINVAGSGRPYNATTGAPVFDFSKTYTQMSKKARAVFDSYVKNKKQKGATFSGRIGKTQISSSGLSQEFILDNTSMESLLKMKTEDRTRLFQSQPGLKDIINRNFIHQITDACPAADKATLQFCVQQVLSQKPLAFFVGGNIEGMTGILGEIQAMYYFSKLLGGQPGKVKWIGGIGNPHADILLIDGLKQFGIQVKNTSRSDAELEVAFQSFGAKAGSYVVKSNGYGAWEYSNTEEGLDNLGVVGISNELIEAIQTFLAMEGFNIYYKYDSSSKKAVATESNEAFANERQAIEEYANYGQQIASLLSVSAMYMQEGFSTKGASNTLYLIGGATLISSATILRDIVNRLKSGLVAFKTKVSGRKINSKGTSSAKTIVDVINSDGHLSNTKFMFESSYTFGI